MAYNSGDLTPIDTTNANWGLAWTRFFLHDTDDANELFTDAELSAVLEARSWAYDSVTYYRPHLAAGDLIEADPDRAITESTLGASFTSRSPSSIARTVRKAGAWVDEAIEDVAGRKPASHLTLTPRF